MTIDWLTLFIYGLSCFRLSVMFGQDGEPYRFGLPLALYWFGRALDVIDDRVVLVGDVLLLWMALSALAILFNRMFPKR